MSHLGPRPIVKTDDKNKSSMHPNQPHPLVHGPRVVAVVLQLEALRDSD